MPLDLVFRNKIKQSEFSEEFFRSVFEMAAGELGLEHKKIEISVSLVDPAEIQELNKTHRDKDRPTDVLSFPLHEGVLNKYDIMPLGDIFICFDVATKDALEEGISIREEMARLAVHGFLHLLGYDHPDDSVGTPTLRRRGEKMFALEEKILDKFKNSKSQITNSKLGFDA